jgi:putative ABC transport system permease protein
MIRNYFKTTVRFLLKSKMFSLINIIGLAVGTLCCLYILLYVKDQYSYDKSYDRAGDIYRVTTWTSVHGATHQIATSSPPVAPALKQDFAQVEQFTRMVTTSTLGVKEHQLQYKDRSFYVQNAVFVDSTFFEVFTFHFNYGNASYALSEPYSVVLLKPIANRLFGNEDPLGKVIEINNSYGRHAFKVTGVVDESRGKSHIHANIFLSMDSNGMGDYTRTDNTWSGNNFAASYVKLYPHANASVIERQLPAFLKKHAANQLKDLGMEKRLHLQPVGTIHTNAEYEFGTDKTVSSSFLYILILIAVLIQVIACINFMNLSTARASQRAREVGVRKVIGAGKTDLIRQFLGESFLLAFIGVLIALPLLLLFMPYLNQITGADIHVALLGDARLWFILAALITVTGLLAGSYPAFYLSAFQAIKVIKGNFANHISASGLRRGMVVFQFIISIVLITGIIIIYSQLHFIEHKDLGFDKNQEIIFTFYTDQSKGKIPAFEQDLKRIPDIQEVTRADNYPSQFVGKDYIFFLAGGNVNTGQDIQCMFTDENFVKVTGIRLASGRDFRVNDSGRVLVNETLVHRLGLDDQTALGKRLVHPEDPGEPISSLEIVGVMKDFNYSSLRDPVRPFMLRYNNDNTEDKPYLIAKTTSVDYPGLLGKLETVWHKDLPGEPFGYTFLDAEVQKQYETEITLSRIINSFTLMAILISGLGLFGLAAFSAEQRIKEIGIRKVLGASTAGIVRLLSRDFLKLVLISFVIASPIAWWVMNQWLRAFAYRVPVSWWMFGLAGLIAVAIALSTVSFQAIRSALANPVRSLKSE